MNKVVTVKQCVKFPLIAMHEKKKNPLLYLKNHLVKSYKYLMRKHFLITWGTAKRQHTASSCWTRNTRKLPKDSVAAHLQIYYL